jgi:hypothetical protein
MLALALILVGNSVGQDQGVDLKPIAKIRDNEWRDLSVVHTQIGPPFKITVLSACATGPTVIGPDEGVHTYYKIVAETDPPPMGEAPNWSAMFTPTGQSSPWDYNWNFGQVSMTTGQGYTHSVTFLKNADQTGEYTYSIPAVEHWVWGYEEGEAFYILDHAKRTNGSETSHNQVGEIHDDCGGHDS